MPVRDSEKSLAEGLMYRINQYKSLDNLIASAECDAPTPFVRLNAVASTSLNSCAKPPMRPLTASLPRCPRRRNDRRGQLYEPYDLGS